MDSWDFFIFSFFSLFFYLFPYLTPISLSLSQAFFAIATIAPMGVMTTLTITIVTPPTTTLHLNPSSFANFGSRFWFSLLQIQLWFSCTTVIATPTTTISISWVCGDGFHFNFLFVVSSVLLWWFWFSCCSWGFWFVDLWGKWTHGGDANDVANMENHNLDHHHVVIVNMENRDLNVIIMVEGLTLVQTIIAKHFWIRTTTIGALVSWW